MNYKTKWLVLVVLLALTVIASGCASFNKNSASTIGTIAVGVNATMDALDEMYTVGYINEETKEKIVDIHKAYRVSHRALVTALQVYKATEGADKELQKLTIEQGMVDLQALIFQLSTILLESKDLAARDETSKLIGDLEELIAMLSDMKVNL